MQKPSTSNLVELAVHRPKKNAPQVFSEVGIVRLHILESLRIDELVYLLANDETAETGINSRLLHHKFFSDRYPNDLKSPQPFCRRQLVGIESPLGT